MNFICNGTCENNKCTNKVIIPNGYCIVHNKNEKDKIILTKKKIVLPSNKNKIQLPNKENISTNHISQDCPICLCEIDKDDEDTGLICNHKFHIECLNNIQKSECPVCRGPLQFVKNTKVDIDKIKFKEEEENLLKQQKQIIEDNEFSMRLQNEQNPYLNNNLHRLNRNNNRNNNMFFDIMITFEELEELEELRELELINIAIENSLIVNNKSIR